MKIESVRIVLYKDNKSLKSDSLRILNLKELLC